MAVKAVCRKEIFVYFLIIPFQYSVLFPGRNFNRRYRDIPLLSYRLGESGCHDVKSERWFSLVYPKVVFKRLATGSAHA